MHFVQIHIIKSELTHSLYHEDKVNDFLKKIKSEDIILVQTSILESNIVTVVTYNNYRSPSNYWG